MRDEVLETILEVLGSINEGRPPDNRIELSPETALLGRNSRLDSLEFVNFLLDAEEQLRQRLGVPIALMDERAMSRAHSPFRNVQSLRDFVVEQLEGQYV